MPTLRARWVAMLQHGREVLPHLTVRTGCAAFLEVEWAAMMYAISKQKLSMSLLFLFVCFGLLHFYLRPWDWYSPESNCHPGFKNEKIHSTEMIPTKKSCSQSANLSTKTYLLFQATDSQRLHVTITMRYLRLCVYVHAYFPMKSSFRLREFALFPCKINPL